MCFGEKGTLLDCEIEMIDRGVDVASMQERSAAAEQRFRLVRTQFKGSPGILQRRRQIMSKPADLGENPVRGRIWVRVQDCPADRLGLPQVSALQMSTSIS